MSGAAQGHALHPHILVDNLKYGFYRTVMEWDAELDATALLCPLPVLKARKRLQALSSGQVLRVLADDPAAVIDMPHFCAEAGHELLATEDQGDVQVYFIRKA